MDATNEAITAAIARESYLEWVPFLSYSLTVSYCLAFYFYLSLSLSDILTCLQVKDNSRGGIKTDSNVASSSRCEQKKHHQAEPTVTQQFGNTETSAEITEYDSVVTSDQVINTVSSLQYYFLTSDDICYMILIFCFHCKVYYYMFENT